MRLRRAFLFVTACIGGTVIAILLLQIHSEDGETLIRTPEEASPNRYPPSRLHDAYGHPGVLAGNAHIPQSLIRNGSVNEGPAVIVVSEKGTTNTMEPEAGRKLDGNASMYASSSSMKVATHSLVITGANVDSSPKVGVRRMASHDRPDLDSNYTALRKEMERCSCAMGVSEIALKEDQDTVMAVSEKASLFLQALWQVVPKNFSKEYKSPCWKGGKANKLYCLPYFMIAGFPKSGTTSLHYAISNHPEIPHSRAESKEPHWWTRHNPGDTGKVPKDYLPAIESYLRILQHQSHYPKSVAWDNSQSTLWDSPFFMDTQDYCALPVVVSRLLPDLKFIIQMRDPVSRIYSHYLYSCSSTLGTNPAKWPKDVRLHTAETFHALIASDVREFNECLRSASLYECTNRMTSKFKAIRWTNTCAFISHQTFVGLYYVHIAKWLQFYPRENFLFLRIDDMSEPYKLVTKITNFLGISPASRDAAERWFSKKANAQKAFSSSDSRKHEMREDTRELLEELYRPYNEMLAELIGDDRFLFRDEDSQ